MSEVTEKICIECEKENIEKVNYTEEVDIRGEKIKVETGHWHCKDCDSYWRVLGEDDFMAKALRVYREKHNMVQPEEIKKRRQMYGLTQGDLAKIFGCGIVTISRYERGSLQSKIHENMLKLLRSPEKFYEFISKKELEDKEKYLKKIEKSSDLKQYLPLSLLENLLAYKGDEFAGFQDVSVDKIRNAILFFCKDGIYMTKLNKLLFYSDFRHFKENTLGITGLKYKHLPYGPVPEYYKTILDMLVASGDLKVDIKDFGNYIGELYTSVVKPDFSVFSEDELRVLLEIKKRFADLSSAEISDISHKEKAWNETEENELISYRYAMELEG